MNRRRNVDAENAWCMLVGALLASVAWWAMLEAAR
jgi:hypothetical protein